MKSKTLERACEKAGLVIKKEGNMVSAIGIKNTVIWFVYDGNAESIGLIKNDAPEYNCQTFFCHTIKHTIEMATMQ